MKKFKEMESNNHYIVYSLIKSINEKEARNGSVFLDITLSDGEKEIVAKLFDCNEKKFGLASGTIINVDIQVSIYNNSLSYVIKAYRPVKEDENINIKDFIISAPYDEEKMYNSCIKTIQDIETRRPELGLLARSIYEDYKDKILYWSAAKGMHHNIYGGWIYHSWRMMKSANQITKIYVNADADIVIIGCLLHDIGKFKELETDHFGTANYTIDGNLFGHLLIGVELITEYGNKLETPEEELRALKHIIASHHYTREFGAISLTQTMEAFLVSQIDNLDAKMYIYENTEKELYPGEMTDRPVYDGIRIYKSELK